MSILLYPQANGDRNAEWELIESHAEYHTETHRCR